MKGLKYLAVSLLLSAVVWAAFSWPLPRYCTTGIPSSSQNIEKDHVRAMIPGDHLQLLYNFWLAGEMLAGRAPFLHNVYEFNRGDDADRYEPRHYYAPFAVTYILLTLLGATRALAWNLVGFLSLWGTFIMTHRLVRRYGATGLTGLALGLLGMTLPYRWVNLLGGSPAGFAMMWVPGMLLGLDIAVRDRRASGGVLAGFSILMARFGDIHVFFFGALLAPAWCLFCLLYADRKEERWSGALRSLIRALWPCALLGGLAVAYSLLRKGEISASTTSGGRGLAEVALASPLLRHMFEWRASGLPSHVYIGYIAPLLVLGTGLLFFASKTRKPAHASEPWRVWALPALAVVIVGVLVLALGLNGPFGGKLLLAARKLVPPYEMVRQPAKIFCLLPPLLAVFGTLCERLLRVRLPNKRVVAVCVCAGVLGICVEHALQCRTTVCLLKNEQAAYAAVVADAERAGRRPHIMVLPIWPGDSAWTSVPEHYISLYSIRMLNGYSPVVNETYYREVFERFKAANKGTLTDAQLDELTGMGVYYVVLHENAFPEKVSPFSVWFTMKRLLNHPRLRLLENSDGVWAFRILDIPQRDAPVRTEWNTYSPSRTWSARACESNMAVRETAGGSAFVRLASDQAYMITRATSMGSGPKLRWMIRARGKGDLLAQIHGDGDALRDVALHIDSFEWRWYELPNGPLPGHVRLALRLAQASGIVEVGRIVLAAGEWPLHRFPASYSIPATALFHAGVTDLSDGSVTMRADSDPDAVILYGPCLPLPQGVYDIALVHSAKAAPGELSGAFSVDGTGMEATAADVRAGAGATRVRLTVKEALPVRCAFEFFRNHDITIHELVITRVPDEGVVPAS